MIVILVEFIIVILGLSATAVLFYRLPVLPGIKYGRAPIPSVSVIIPARNEEENIALLLADLSAQTSAAHEIICVDDASEDETARIAAAHGARLIRLHDKPEGWTGKTWACQKGADTASGQLLLFLDADVRLGKDSVRKLIQAYRCAGCTISVQPYHRTEKIYEQLSMLPNLVQIAANGTALPTPLNIGLHGPVILIDRADYLKVGGHECVKNSLVEDIALGQQLKKAGLSYRLFIGEEDIAYRMYSGGLRSLLQGWVKNVAAGAEKTPLPVFLMIFFWIASLASVPLQLVKFAILANMPWLMVYSFLYLVWAAILAILAGRVGRFHRWAFACYPLLVLVLLGIFAVSMFKKAFGLQVTWKGRAIKTGKKPCA